MRNYGWGFPLLLFHASFLRFFFLSPPLFVLCLRLKSSLSPSLPLKQEKTLLSLIEKLSASDSTQHSGTNISMVLKTHGTLSLLYFDSRRMASNALCAWKTLWIELVWVCARWVGWRKNTRKSLWGKKEGKISQQNSTAQEKCFVLCHAIAKHTIALFSMTSS